MGVFKLSGESFSSPSPNPTLSSSKTFDFIESLFVIFLGAAFLLKECESLFVIFLGAAFLQKECVFQC